MEAMRETWTDARLDDLNHKVDDLARRVDARFDRLEGRFDAYQRAMLQMSGLIVAALLGVIATQL
jgi:hypothetical protein